MKPAYFVKADGKDYLVCSSDISRLLKVFQEKGINVTVRKSEDYVDGLRFVAEKPDDLEYYFVDTGKVHMLVLLDYDTGKEYIESIFDRTWSYQRTIELQSLIFVLRFWKDGVDY